MMTLGKSGEHLAEPGTPSLYQMVLGLSFDDLGGKKWGTFSGSQDPLLVSDGVLWPSYDDLRGKKWGTFSGSQDPLLQKV